MWETHNYARLLKYIQTQDYHLHSYLLVNYHKPHPLTPVAGYFIAHVRTPAIK